MRKHPVVLCSFCTAKLHFRLMSRFTKPTHTPNLLSYYSPSLPTFLVLLVLLVDLTANCGKDPDIN